MREMMLVVVAISALAVVSPGEASAQTVTAFKTGERTTGMTKQCIYEALGSEYTRTVRVVAPCPLSLQVEVRSAEVQAASTRNAWQTLAEGLSDLGQILQQQRDAKKQLDAPDLLTEADSAELRQQTRYWAYEILLNTLLDEYLASDEYKVAVDFYYEIQDLEGLDRANQFWKYIQTEAQAYIEKKWLVLTPEVWLHPGR